MWGTLCQLTIVAMVLEIGEGNDIDCSRQPCLPCSCQAYKTCGGFFRVNSKGIKLFHQGDKFCLHCQWILSVDKGNKVKLSLSKFHLGSGDSLEVLDGKQLSSDLIVKYTAHHQPRQLVSSGGHMTVLLKTDSCANDTEIQGTVSPTGCGGLFRVSPRRRRPLRIRYLPYPRLYTRNENCLWTVVGKYGKPLSVKIVVQGIPIGSQSQLNISDSLEKGNSNTNVYAGMGSGSPNVYTVRNTPGLLVSFTSNGYGKTNGFHLTVSSLRTGFSCQRPSNLPYGTVTVSDFGNKAIYRCCSRFRLQGAAEKVCSRGKWIPDTVQSCSRVTTCTVPASMMTDDGSTFATLGRTVNLCCKYGYRKSGKDNCITASCMCNGSWSYPTAAGGCKLFSCGPPPDAPGPNGAILGGGKTVYLVGATVNYTCPNGLGLNGVPYRTCTASLRWEPFTKVHKCQENLNVCPDPGVPENGFRRVQSFGHGYLSAFGCIDGFRREGSTLRVCDASAGANFSWTNKPAVCISKFKSAELLAAQLRENFIDRTAACVDNFNETEQSVENRASDAIYVTKAKDCRGRAVVIGEGCIDLIFAADCSLSVGKENFIQSLEFVGKAASLFDIDGGTARVALVTYDHEIHYDFGLDEINTTEAIITALNNVTFCGGTTATRPVLKFIRDKILSVSRPQCRRAIFILTDGNNNWAGDPLPEATELKKQRGVEIYAIAFGTEDISWTTLRSLASKPSYFFAVKKAVDMNTALKRAFVPNKTKDYCRDCGVTRSPGCDTGHGNRCSSKLGSWPWMVGIHVWVNERSRFHCGGTIVGDCWVLTAAHCVVDRDVSNLLVVAGDTMRFVKEYSEETYVVDKVFVPSDYDPDTWYHKDIALLKLSCNISCSPRVMKACLPTANDSSFYTTRSNCIVAGWGSTKQRTQNETAGAKQVELKELHLPTVDRTTCIEQTSPDYKEDITDFTICAGDGSGNDDPCDGDSGGPLFCKRLHSEEYVVIGVVSWGDGCKLPGKYGVFTHVLKMRKWIDYTMQANTCSQLPSPGSTGTVAGNQEKKCSQPPTKII